MSITDELREAINQLRVECEEKEGCGVLWYPEPTRDRFSAIADRIDIAHKHAIGYVDDRDPETMAEHGWMRLPKDADGETIRIGDVMEWCDPDGEVTVTCEVDAVGVECFFAWDGANGRYAQKRASAYRHHHEPTVEDVLREFAQKMNENIGMYMGEAIDADEWRDADAKNIAEYAAKLRLAGDAE